MIFRLNLMTIGFKSSRAFRVRRIVEGTLILLFGLGMGLSPSYAGTNAESDNWAAASDEVIPLRGVTQKTIDARLGQIRALDVETFFPRSELDNRFPQELTESVRKAVLETGVLPYKSPAKAVIRLRCGVPRCDNVVVQVVLDRGNTVLWEEQVRFKPAWYQFWPDYRGIARKIVQQLNQDYEASRQKVSQSAQGDSHIPLRP